jgi:hypothetical protein
MTEPETDLEMIGRIYRDTIAATKRDNPAYHAALTAWRERHPEAEERAAKETVAILICHAIDDGLVWGHVRWWSKHGSHSPPG